MTDEQILELVKEYFDVGGIRDDGSCSEYYGKPDTFLKFARALYMCSVKPRCIAVVQRHTQEVALHEHEVLLRKLEDT